DLVGQLGGQLPLVVRGDERLRLAVVEDVVRLADGEPGRHARVVQAGALGGPRGLEIAGVVLHADGDGVARTDPTVVEQLGQLVRAVVELLVRDLFAAAGQDVGDLVRRGLGVISDVRCHGAGLYRGWL